MFRTSASARRKSLANDKNLKQLRQQQEEEQEHCPICFETLLKEPISAQESAKKTKISCDCDHYFCEECLSLYVATSINAKPVWPYQIGVCNASKTHIAFIRDGRGSDRGAAVALKWVDRGGFEVGSADLIFRLFRSKHCSFLTNHISQHLKNSFCLFLNFAERTFVKKRLSQRSSEITLARINSGSAVTKTKLSSEISRKRKK